MLGQLISLPMRIGIAATRLMLEAAEEAVGSAARTARQLTAAGGTPSAHAKPREPDAQAKPRESDARVMPREPDAEANPRQLDTEEPLVRPELAVTEPGGDAEASREPRHVSEEPELVEEVAEPGAEHGAGAEVHVERGRRTARRSS
jgi:hypothetical protein